MAHEITIRANGKAEVAWAGQLPWHGLGIELKAGTRPTDALGAAGMEWEPKRVPLFFDDVFGKGIAQEVPDRFAIVRSDTGHYLGNVGRRYTAIGHREQAEWIEALVGEGNCAVECAGTLFGGAQQFWTVKVGETAIEAEKRADRIRQYMILHNHHDGRGSFRAFWSPVRVVCNNTLRAAFRSMETSVALRHTTNIKNRMEQARKVLGVCAAYYDAVGESFQKMAETRITKEQYEAALDSIFKTEPAEGATEAQVKEAEIELLEIKNQVTENLKKEAQMFGLSRITAWDGYNSATYYASHQLSSRRTKTISVEEQRFDRVLFGEGHRIQLGAIQAFGKLAGLEVAAAN